MDCRALVLVLSLATTASADKKIQGMTPGFQREAQTCATQVSGLRKVQTGAASLAPTLSPEDRTALDKDLEALKAGLVGVEAYCTAVTELVAFLEASKDAAYKSVEKELDTRDNAVRKLRKESKKIIETTAPITRRWIGRIAQNQVQRPAEVKPKPTAFPSGRSAVLPNLGKGTWKVEGHKSQDLASYVEGDRTATVMVSSFQTSDCEAARTTLKSSPLADALTRVEGLELAWHVQLRSGDRTFGEGFCVRLDGGRIVATFSQSPVRTDTFPLIRRLALDLARAHVAAAKTP